ncbi:MAG: dipeptide ABC transporter ATP-binding protein [Geitlerinemataceae cyanobacterium]
MSDRDFVLDIRNLSVEFPTETELVRAVAGMSFQVERGQTIGIVGESGSGKSVTSQAVMGLVPSPGRVTSGEILLKSTPDATPIDLLAIPDKQLRRYRGGEMAVVFQEPMSALNPVYSIGYQICEAILQHQNVSPEDARQQAIERLQEVKLLADEGTLRDEAKREIEAQGGEVHKRDILKLVGQRKQALLDRYPHQLSGGQLQRVTIAMAISCNPTLLIADEPTTALDVTVQATILTLLRELRDRHQMSMMFVSHDLGVIAEVADVVAVMYRGELVEVGTVDRIFANPQHPYTKGLIACRPQLDRRMRILPTVADFMEVTTDEAGAMQIVERTPDFESQAIDGEGEVGDRSDLERIRSILEAGHDPEAEETAPEKIEGRPASEPPIETVEPSAALSDDEPSDADEIGETDPAIDRLSAIASQSQEIEDDRFNLDNFDLDADSEPMGTLLSAADDLSPPPRPSNKPLTDVEVAQRLAYLQRQPPLLDVRNLKVGYPQRGLFGRARRYTMAVNDISFQVFPGETLGLVGESGCGKSTLARTLMRLIDPLSGQMRFEDRDILNIPAKDLRFLRRDMQTIFQDPGNALNPRLSVGAAILEPMEIHNFGESKAARLDRVRTLLTRVGLDPSAISRYPHEFSGGQRQRICIARALALEPKFVICDESVSALDVSVQAQVLNLLKELQEEFGLTYIFISHDLSVVKFMSDRIMVMNQGRIEEIGPADRVYRRPEREYTRKLIDSIPQGYVPQPIAS